LRVFENRLLRRIFGHKRYEYAGGWRRLHYEELHNLYASLNVTRVIISRMMDAGNVACMGEMRYACEIVIGKLKWKTGG